MKFLILDDEEDLRDILTILITANFDVNIYQAQDGAQGIELLSDEGPFDLVICDYKMPHKNGFDVYSHLRNTSPQTPFLLVTADDKDFLKKVPNPVLFEHVSKPFNEDQLLEKIKSLLVKKELPQQKQIHIPIPLELLRKVENTGTALYIRLSENHFIKALKADALFNQFEYERFKRKKVEHLYIELIEIKQFISNFRRHIFSLVDWNNVDITEAQKVLEHDWELILEAHRNFGWSNTIAELSRENITRTLALIEREPHMKKYFERLKLENSKYKIPLHCYLLAFVTTALLKELGWNSPSTLRKMSFACLLHDIELNDVMFKNKLDVLVSEKMQHELNQPVNYAIFNHCTKAAEIVNHWSSCPPDVDKIILQHHEKLDGTGFPHKLNFLTIFPLAAVFILSEDLVYKKTESPGENLYSYLKQKESYYSRGDLKSVYQAALKVTELL